jgi:PAS domain S-box-containing protein
MEDTSHQSQSAGNLRHEAEQRLDADTAAATPSGRELDALALIHELQVHQVELEMQNEELRRAQQELTALGARYRDLYDYAPIGYLALDARGRILEINLTGAALLGVGRRNLIGRSFTTLLSEASQTAYRLFVCRLHETEGRHTCELSLTQDGGTLRYLQAEAVVRGEVEEADTQIRLAVIEITERKQLEKAAHESAHRLAEQEKQAAVLRERNRIAQDIHDTLAQGFTGILVQLEAADCAPEQEQVRMHIARARDLARESLQEARHSVHALRPHPLEGGGLQGALARLVRQSTSVTSYSAQFQIFGVPYPLAPEVEEHLYRIGQEAVTNAIRHAEATEIRVELFFEPAEMRLCIQDDGRGFDMHSTFQTSGFGLTGMYERTEHIGAQMLLASHPGQGTSITITVPTAPAGPL